MIINLFLYFISFFQKIMKKSLFLLLFVPVLLLSWCGLFWSKDQASNTWSIDTSIDPENPYDGAQTETFITWSTNVLDQSGSIDASGNVVWNILTDVQPSRPSDNWCVRKSFDKFGVSFLAEECDFDGRSLKVTSIDSQKIFAIEQDWYAVNEENLQDNLLLQVFDVQWAIANDIKNIAWTNCEIKTTQDVKIPNHDAYVVYGSIDDAGNICNWYGHVEWDPINRVFLVDKSNTSKFVFINTSNEQSVLDTNSIRLK